jgi:hypothetical protein
MVEESIDHALSVLKEMRVKIREMERSIQVKIGFTFREVPRAWTGSPEPPFQRQSPESPLYPASPEAVKWRQSPKTLKFIDPRTLLEPEPVDLQIPVIEVPDSLEEADLLLSLHQFEPPPQPSASSSEAFLTQSCIPASYASVVASPAKEKPKASSPAPKIRPSLQLLRVKNTVEQETGLRCVYVTGLPRLKVGELRQFLRDKKFTVDKLYNLSYMGPSVCEVLMPEHYLPAFEKLARSYSYKTNVHFDPMDPSDHSMDRPLVGYHNGINTRQKQDIFLERIGRDVKSTKNASVGKFYGEWARKLGRRNYFELYLTSFNHKKVFFPCDSR